MNEKDSRPPFKVTDKQVKRFMEEKKDIFLGLSTLLKLSEFFPNFKNIFIGKNSRFSTNDSNTRNNSSQEETVFASTESPSNDQHPQNIIELRKMFEKKERAFNSSKTIDFAALPDDNATIPGASSSEQLMRMSSQSTTETEKFVAEESDESKLFKEKWSVKMVLLEEMRTEVEKDSIKVIAFTIATELVTQFVFQKNKEKLKDKYLASNDLPIHFILEYLHKTISDLSLPEIKAWLATNISEISRSKVNTPDPIFAQEAIKYFSKYMGLVTKTDQLAPNALLSDEDFKNKVVTSLLNTSIQERPKPKLLTQSFRPVSGSDLQQ